MNNFNKQYLAGPVTYGYFQAGRTWSFSFQNKQGQTTSYLCAAGGKDTAAKAANILAGSLKRKGEIDGLARANIEKVLT